MNWKLAGQNADLLRFCRSLIQFRREQPTVRRKRFFTGRPTAHSHGLPDVSWYGAHGGALTDWHSSDLALTALLMPPDPEDDPRGLGRAVLLFVNSTPTPREFAVPEAVGQRKWRVFCNTAASAPNDVFPKHDGPMLPSSGRFVLPYRSLCCCVEVR